MTGEREQALELTLAIPDELIAALADRISATLRQQPPSQPDTSPWLDTEGACAYLGMSRQQLYKLTAARAIPMRKKRDGHGLLFHKGELNAWLEAAYESTGWTPKLELSSSSDSDR